MAIELTTEIVVPDIKYQGVTKIEFVLPHALDTGAMKIDRPNVGVIFYITTWAGDGSELSVNRHLIPLAEWTTGFLTDVKDMYAKVEQYAISNGYMGDGTGEVLTAAPSPTPDPTVTPMLTPTPSPA